jgi:hypothetical protein
VLPTFVSLPAANTDLAAPYFSGFAVAGAPPPTVTQVSGELPPGLTLRSDGNLTGTPTPGRPLAAAAPTPSPTEVDRDRDGGRPTRSRSR